MMVTPRCPACGGYGTLIEFGTSSYQREITEVSTGPGTQMWTYGNRISLPDFDYASGYECGRCGCEGSIKDFVPAVTPGAANDDPANT